MKKCRFFLKVKKGFTLVELIAVMAIMAIATALVLPNLRGLISETEFREVENYCITANTYTRNYVNLLNTLEKEVPYFDEEGELQYYDISTPSGLSGALNQYRMDQEYQYYVLAFNASQSVDPTESIKTLYSQGKLKKDADTMIVNIKYNNKKFRYTLNGFWYYKADKSAIVCSYRSTGGQSGKGFKRLDKDIT